jgi:hypothetical protein
MAEDKAISLSSPDDCFVSQMYAVNGKVRKGDKILLLRSLRSEHLLGRVENMLATLEIHRRWFKDGRSDEAKKLQASLESKLEDEVNQAQIIVAQYRGQVEAGVSEEGPVAQAKLELRDRQMAHDQQKNKLSEFDQRIKDTLDRLELAQAHLQKEQALLNDFRTRLLILAPCDGELTLYSAEGSFVELGGILGAIEGR